MLRTISVEVPLTVIEGSRLPRHPARAWAVEPQRRVQYVPHGQSRGLQDWKPVGVIGDDRGLWFFEHPAEYAVELLKHYPPAVGEDLSC